MLLKESVCACALALLTQGVFAHGPQMQITAEPIGVGQSKIVTRSILTDTYFPITSPKSVYVMEVLPYRGVWYVRPETKLNAPNHPTAPGQPIYYSGPGLAYGVGTTFAPGSALSINFLDGLQLWNGSSFVDAGSTELQHYRGGSIGSLGQLINPTASITTVDSNPSPLLSFPAIPTPEDGYGTESHSTARLRFLGDGTMPVEGTGTTATEPGPGVYLASLVLSSDDPSVADSDPFYFVMHKGVPWSEVATAVKSLNFPNSSVQVLGIPEPSALALTAIASGIVCRRRYSA